MQSNSLALAFDWFLVEGADGSLVDVGAENSWSNVPVILPLHKHALVLG